VTALFVPLWLALSPQAARPEEPYQERIAVERVVVNAHAVDNSGSPIEGLTASDFRLRVDGRPAALESVEWVGTDWT